MRTALLLAAAFIGCLGARSVHAAVETATVSIAPGPAGYAEAIRIPQFDGSEGTLESVTISLAATGNFVQRYENMGSEPEPVVISQDLQMGLELRTRNWQFPQQIISLSQIQASDYRPAAFDGHIGFGGSSGGTYTYPVTAAGQATLVSFEDLAQFTGEGFADVYLYLSTEVTLQQFVSGGQGVAEGSLVVGGDIAVSYDYVLTVPESSAWGPASVILLGGALAVQSRRSKRGCSFAAGRRSSLRL
ncbi:MAG TPA: choice-of-anchor E domain-containing protein [Dongiaceae bacterium]|nr:choice-of-anchor E domain-containing protein [Dongiaceae bacterium]